MKKKLFLFICLLVLFSSSALAESNPIELNVEIEDDTPHYPDFGKVPMRIPHIYQDGYTLTLSSFHPEYIFNIIQDGVLVYTSIIPASATQFELPAFVSGECTVQFVTGRFCLTGYVQL